MRGTKAKRLRRMAYGDLSLKTGRKYEVTHRSWRPVPGVIAQNGLPVMGEAVTVRNRSDSPRGVYKRLKALFA